jgi:hypothetical protein
MATTITLRSIVDRAISPDTRAQIYQQAKSSVPACSSCSFRFRRVWAQALAAGIIVRVGRKFALRGWRK